jgi:hypothetical protein
MRDAMSARGGGPAAGSVSCAHCLIEPRDRSLVSELRHHRAGSGFPSALARRLLRPLEAPGLARPRLEH